MFFQICFKYNKKIYQHPKKEKHPNLLSTGKEFHCSLHDIIVNQWQLLFGENKVHLF